MTAKDNLGGYKEVHEITGLPYGTLYSMVHRHEIPHFRISKRSVRFNLRIVKEWFDKKAVPVAGTSDRGAEND